MWNIIFILKSPSALNLIVIIHNSSRQNYLRQNLLGATKKLLKKQEAKIKKAVSDGKILNPSEYWKMCLYIWSKEHKGRDIKIVNFFAIRAHDFQLSA